MDEKILDYDDWFSISQFVSPSTTRSTTSTPTNTAATNSAEATTTAMNCPQPSHPSQRRLSESFLPRDSSPDTTSLRRLSLDNPHSSSIAAAAAFPPAPARSYSSPVPNLPPTLPLQFTPSPSLCLSERDRDAYWPAPSAPGHAAALPEFAGSGAINIFKPPPRAAVHPGRPPSIELRPRPLRETQAGCFVRTIAGSEGQLWAGSENGVRVWELGEVFEGFGRRGFEWWRPKRGDEESAPFRESRHTSPTLCLVVDEANRVIWSGHKDGKIRSWRMELPKLTNEAHERGGDFAEGFSWQAHRAPVLSMVITPQGTLAQRSF